MIEAEIAQRLIKPLVWEAGEFPDEMTAGNYNIWHEGHGFQVYHWSIVCGEPHPTLAAAQAAAEADYRARILAALDLAPVVALVEAGQPILDMLMFTESAGDGESVIMRAGTIRKMRAALAAFRVQP